MTEPAAGIAGPALAAHSPRYLTGQRIGAGLSIFSRFLRERLSVSRAPDRLLSIEERLVIGPKKTLLLVNCAGRRFLVAAAGETIAPIVEVGPSMEDCSSSGDCRDGVL